MPIKKLHKQMQIVSLSLKKNRNGNLNKKKIEGDLKI